MESDPDALQKLVGTVIISASICIALIDFATLVGAKNYSIMAAIADGNIIAVAATGVLGLFTLLVRNSLTKWLQVLLFFLTAFLNALTIQSGGDLSSGVFLLFGSVLFMEYDLRQSRFWFVIIILLCTYPISLIIGYSHYSSTAIIQALLVIIGVAVILLLFGAVLLRHEYRHRQDKELLESRVKERTRELETSLAERSVMLDEIHHRVKNNLQLVTSLLSLEADRLEEGPARAPLEASMRQIYAMALVHDTLYRSERLDEIDLVEYSAKLLDALKSFPAVDYELKAEEPIVVKLEYAVAFGLLLNELVTEAMEAWVPSTTGPAAQGEVAIARAEDGGILLSVETRGAIARRSPDMIDRDPVIVSAIVEQLKGRIERLGASGELVRVHLGLPRPALP
jgi:Signal transduction histidine kinase